MSFPETSHVKIAEGFNVLPLQASINQQPELFGQFKQRAQMYMSPHTGMKDIWVRYNDIGEYTDMATFNDEHEPIWYPAFYCLPAITNILIALMQMTEGQKLGGVLITKVPPGGRIEPHTDHGWHAEYYSKFYIPIQNSEGAEFHFADGTIKPNLGDVWWFDNSVEHWVVNDSNEDRLALIVCIRTDKYPRQRHNESNRTDPSTARDI